MALLVAAVFTAPAYSQVADTLAPTPNSAPESIGLSQSGEEESDTEGSAEAGSVSTLLQDETTTELHDDNTILRNVGVTKKDESGAVLFDTVRIWIGGLVQYDYHNFDGIYSHIDGGERREGGDMRRLEGTLRSQLRDWVELKAQYDFNDGIIRDLYLRWVSDKVTVPLTLTVGNQKEPIGLDHLTGTKFGTAQELAAPVQAFSRWRSMGVRLHRSFELRAEERKFDYWDDDSAFMTTSFGVFGGDLENTNDTDLAVTGRVTAGRRKEGVGQHIGLSASYREGDFYRISMRPEVREADRVTLGRPEANTMGIVAAEGAYNRGPLHMQAELFAANYSGRVNGYGAGGYFQAGWYLSGESRNYQPEWGVLAPHTPTRSWSSEVFVRVSHTRGDDDVNGWNDYKSLTLGGNVFYRKARASLNLLYGESQYPLDGEIDGVAFVARLQYLF